MKQKYYNIYDLVGEHKEKVLVYADVKRSDIISEKPTEIIISVGPLTGAIHKTGFNPLVSSLTLTTLRVIGTNLKIE